MSLCPLATLVSTSQHGPFFNSNHVKVVGISKGNTCSVSCHQCRPSFSAVVTGIALIITRMWLALALGMWTASLVSVATMGIFIEGQSIGFDPGLRWGADGDFFPSSDLWEWAKIQTSFGEMWHSRSLNPPPRDPGP